MDREACLGFMKKGTLSQMAGILSIPEGRTGDERGPFGNFSVLSPTTDFRPI
jgi:hypothetical protein